MNPFLLCLSDSVMNSTRPSLIRDLHELIASPLSKKVYLDIAIQIDGGEPFWTSKLAVYFLFPYLEDVLSSADWVTLSTSSNNDEKQNIIDFLQFRHSDNLDQKKYLFFGEKDQYQLHDHLNDNINPEIQTREEDSYLITCPECPSSFSNKRDLKKHFVKHTNEWYECPVCGKRIKHKKNFGRHLALHDDTKNNYRCNFCGKDFNRKNNYKRHLECVHNLIVS